MTRALALAAAALVLAAGLAVHARASGDVAQVAGGALYAALLFALVVVARPRTRVPVVAAVSLGLCWLVELAQLSPYPARLSARSALARLVLGSTFSVPDLLFYALGTAVAAVVASLAPLAPGR